MRRLYRQRQLFLSLLLLVSIDALLCEASGVTYSHHPSVVSKRSQNPLLTAKQSTIGVTSSQVRSNYKKVPLREIDPIIAQSAAHPSPQIVPAPSNFGQQQPPPPPQSPPPGAPSIGVFPFSGPSSTSSAVRSPPAQLEPELSTESAPTGSLVARIHGNGILGYVLFTPDSSSGSTLIKARLSGPSERVELFNWKIHSYPQQISSVGCSSIAIGPILMDLSSVHGQLQTEKDIAISSQFIDLFSEKSLLGRTIVLHGTTTGVTVCATILPATKKRVFEAKFHWPISGTIRLIQTSSATGILGEYLMYSDGSRMSSSHAWTIVEGLESDSNLELKHQFEADRCFGLEGPSVVPRSAQVLPITVSTEMPGVKGRSYQVVNNLKPIDSSRLPVFFVLFEEDDPKTILACAALTEIKPRSARVRFPSTSDPVVTGSISFNQQSPFDPTKVDVSLKLTKKAYSYGIDLIPTIRRRKNEPKSCPNIKETIYNPFFKDPEEIPPEGLGTSDQYAVGDLSGKFGTLSNKVNEIFTTHDFNLPLFGQFSVIGRAVVVYAPDGPAIACSNIELTGSNITTAYATFDVPLQGQFIFRQPQGECNGETYVYIEISKPDGSKNKKTFNHPWHIHESAVNAGFDHLSSTDCGSAGKHMNPFNVSTECIYHRDCTMFTPLRCEMGDTSGKLGPIDVPTYRSSVTGEPDVGKYYFIDTDLSLCGPNAIVGRSVVIHKENFDSQRLTCANILEFKPRSGS